MVPLNEDGAALVAFDVNNGRRAQSLETHQLANDVMGQLAVNRAVLAQQIDSLASTQATGQPQIGSRGQRPFVIGGTPQVNRNVGFRPEIAVLPTGATMSVTAVVSADRRYVRITALPFFSDIRSVAQFNLATGLVAEDGGDGGGDGGGGLGM